jgi:hypothetical protein
MSVVDSPECSLTGNTIDLIFAIGRLNVGIAGFAYFSLVIIVDLMALVHKHGGFVSLGLHILVEYEGAICVYFECFTVYDFLWLDFGVNLKIFIFLGLFFHFYSL